MQSNIQIAHRMIKTDGYLIICHIDLLDIGSTIEIDVVGSEVQPMLISGTATLDDWTRQLYNFGLDRIRVYCMRTYYRNFNFYKATLVQTPTVTITPQTSDL